MIALAVALGLVGLVVLVGPLLGAWWANRQALAAWWRDVHRGPAQWERLREQLRARPAELHPAAGRIIRRAAELQLAELAPASTCSPPRGATVAICNTSDGAAARAATGSRPMFMGVPPAEGRPERPTRAPSSDWAVLPGFWPAIAASLFDPAAGEEACLATAVSGAGMFSCTRARGHCGAHVAHHVDSHEGPLEVRVVACWADVTREVLS